MEIVFQPEIFIYFVELAEILYEKDYFGFEETAIQYADELFDTVNTNLPTKLKKQLLLILIVTEKIYIIPYLKEIKTLHGTYSLIYIIQTMKLFTSFVISVITISFLTIFDIRFY